MNILEKIIADKQKEVIHQKKQISIKELENTPDYLKNRVSLVQSIYQKKCAILAEIKFKSPSKGIICSQRNPVEIGRGYEQAGAAGISVLTDEKYFAGKKKYLKEVRQMCSIPILQKDFILEEYQIIEARSIGADAILLIAAALSPSKIYSLAKFAKI